MFSASFILNVHGIKSGRGIIVRASVKLFELGEWAYVRQGVYFWAYDTPRVSIFGFFVHLAFRFSA